MARKIQEVSQQWGIYIDHCDGSFGWITQGSGEPYLASSKAEAEKYLKKIAASNKYSFSRPASVQEFTGYKK